MGLKYTGDFEKLKDYGFRKEVFGKGLEDFIYRTKREDVEICEDRTMWTLLEGYNGNAIPNVVYDLIKDNLVEKEDEVYEDEEEFYIDSIDGRRG